MRKLIGAAVAICAMTASSFALFVNGGFESGDFTGWTVKYGTFYGGPAANAYSGINFGYVQSNQPQAQIIDNTFTQPGLSLNIDPFVGNKMAFLNDYYGLYHATEISQTDKITQTDIDNGAKLFVDWGVVLENPSHGAGYDPFFGINVTIGGVTQTFYADGGSAAATWTPAGGYAALSYYKSAVWSYDLSGYAVGTDVTVDLFVSDCAYGGHAGYAFLDGIGTVYQPPSGVPEPGMISMIMIGMLSLTGFAVSRKRK
jgi:hypothetical protein